MSLIADTCVSEAVKQIVAVQNTRLLITRLCGRNMLKLNLLDMEDLVEYGPLKPDNEQGYSEEQLDALGRDESKPKEIISVNGVEFYLNPDPTGRRIGEAVGPHFRQILLQVSEKAKSLINNVTSSINS